LEENFSRVLAQNLSALLTIERIFRHPWPGNRRITHQVEIEILRFEADSAQEAQLAARWSVIDAGTKQPLAIKSSFLRRPSREQSREGSVDAMSEALADLSREIADTVRAIVRQQKPQPERRSQDDRKLQGFYLQDPGKIFARQRSQGARRRLQCGD